MITVVFGLLLRPPFSSARTWTTRNENDARRSRPCIWTNRRVVFARARALTGRETDESYHGENTRSRRWKRTEECAQTSARAPAIGRGVRVSLKNRKHKKRVRARARERERESDAVFTARPPRDTLKHVRQTDTAIRIQSKTLNVEHSEFRWCISSSSFFRFSNRTNYWTNRATRVQFNRFYARNPKTRIQFVFSLRFSYSRNRV